MYLNVILTDDYSTSWSSLNLCDENVYSTPEAVEGTCNWGGGSTDDGMCVSMYMLGVCEGMHPQKIILN